MIEGRRKKEEGRRKKEEGGLYNVDSDKALLLPPQLKTVDPD